MLLNEAYKLDAQEQMKAIVIGDMPHADESQRQRIVSQLQRITDDIINVGMNDDYSGLETLKRQF